MFRAQQYFSGPRISKRARITEPPAFAFQEMKVPNFIQIARSKTMSISARSSILPWVSWRQRKSDFSAIVWRYFNFFPRSLARRGRTQQAARVPCANTRRKVAAREGGSNLRRETGCPQNVGLPSPGAPQDIRRVGNVFIVLKTILMKATIQAGSEVWPPQEGNVGSGKNQS